MANQGSLPMEILIQIAGDTIPRTITVVPHLADGPRPWYSRFTNPFPSRLDHLSALNRFEWRSFYSMLSNGVPAPNRSYEASMRKENTRILLDLCSYHRSNNGTVPTSSVRDEMLNHFDRMEVRIPVFFRPATISVLTVVFDRSHGNRLEPRAHGWTPVMPRFWTPLTAILDFVDPNHANSVDLDRWLATGILQDRIEYYLAWFRGDFTVSHMAALVQNFEQLGDDWVGFPLVDTAASFNASLRCYRAVTWNNPLLLTWYTLHICYQIAHAAAPLIAQRFAQRINRGPAWLPFQLSVGAGVAFGAAVAFLSVLFSVYR